METTSNIKWIENEPIKTNCEKWLLGNIGRYSVARKAPGTDGFVDIVAYSDNSDDIRELALYSKKIGGFVIRNLSKKGEYCID